tara:strand:- start:3970 stop:4197 length:228 start_codon:yes stop_codon:yes gene_type:complete
MTTTTQKTQEQIKLEDEKNCKQVEKLVNTYAEMYDLNCTQALTDCLLTLVRQGDFTTAAAIETLNNTHDEYMEDI